MSELLTALVLGVAGGLAPGPLHSAILSTALRRGARPARRLAWAPLISDTPPVVVSLLLAATVPDTVLRVLAALGGCVMIVWGIQSGRVLEGGELVEVDDRPGLDYFKGAFINILNPHPWIFWVGAGAPLLKLAFDRGTAWGLAWLAVFYLGLIGVKVGLATVVGHGRAVLEGHWLRRSVHAAAVLMVGVGLWMLWLGWTGFV